ncbi:MAG: rhomboid family intramembrane serine protease [Lachnospiraceae bacterium]|nr:rhomboid family intramembrane serine protease [Lachnospiraceae bacterium]
MPCDSWYNYYINIKRGALSLGDDTVKKNIPVITAAIIAINVLVFIFMEIFGSTLDTDFMLKCGALDFEKVIYGKEYSRLITHFFMHFGVEHLINNMFVLAVYGYYMEDFVGKKIFATIYMLSGVIAGIVSMSWHFVIGENVVSAGASGAIFGISGAFIVIMIANRKKIEDFSYVRIGMFLALTVYSGYADKSIDNAAHIAGFIAGGVIIYIFYLLLWRERDNETY